MAEIENKDIVIVVEDNVPEVTTVAKAKGVYHHGVPEEVTFNRLVDEGEDLLLRVAFRDEGATLLPNGFFVGMCADPAVAGEVPEDLTLADLSEPVGNGYARQAIERSAVGWETIDAFGQYMRARSKLLTFTCSTAQWTVAGRRLFLSNVETGTIGKLIAVSGLFDAPVQLNPGDIHPVRYGFLLD